MNDKIEARMKARKIQHQIRERVDKEYKRTEAREYYHKTPSRKASLRKHSLIRSHMITILHKEFPKIYTKVKEITEKALKDKGGCGVK